MAADNTIDYKFFEKVIASKYVMMKNSAMSGRVKMNGLTQEVFFLLLFFFSYARGDPKIKEHERESGLGGR